MKIQAGSDSFSASAGSPRWFVEALEAAPAEASEALRADDSAWIERVGRALAERKPVRAMILFSIARRDQALWAHAEAWMAVSD